MHIDWFTFACQVINFLVLVWLLKRLLYQPVLQAIETREQSITERMQSAAEREATADQSRRAYEQQQAELAHLKDSLLAEAAADVENWRKQQQARVRDEIAEIQTNWHAAVVREQEQFLGELRQRTARQVQDIVRHVLRELSDHELELQSVQRFLSRLDDLLATQPALSGEEDPTVPLVVRTAFPLSGPAREALSGDLTARIGRRSLKFEVDSELICGIEVVAGDRKLEWNIDHYLNALERSINAALDQRMLAQMAH